MCLLSLTRSCSVALVLIALCACSDDNCAREGCDAIAEPVASTSISTGIAGVVATETDLVENGCQECWFASGSFEVWSAPSPITTQEEATALIAAGPSSARIAADPRYELALEPGDYLVCHRSSVGGVCAAVSLAAGQISTIHLKLIFGPPQMRVFDSKSNTPREGGIFSVEGALIR